MSRLAVVVVNYGSSRLLAENLTRVQDELPSAGVVVVDNFTRSAERDAVTRLAASRGWSTVLLDENLGFGAGVNAGAAEAWAHGAAEVLLLNPDASISSVAVEALRAAVADDRLAIAAPTIRRSDGRHWFDGCDLHLEDGSMLRTSRRGERPGAAREEWLTGACLLVTREAWEATGGFDESYFLYWEDVDFSHRVVRAGGHLHLVRGAVAIHDEGGTQGEAAAHRREKSPTYYYYNVRNRLLYASLHLDEDGMRRWLRTAPRAAWEIVLRGGRRQLLHPVRPLGGAVRGLADGRRLVRGALADRRTGHVR